MATSDIPSQLSLFPEIGIEGYWHEFPNDFARMDPDLVALCNEYGFARLCQRFPETPRKAASTIRRDAFLAEVLGTSFTDLPLSRQVHVPYLGLFV
jgi:hypothetical protein